MIEPDAIIPETAPDTRTAWQKLSADEKRVAVRVRVEVEGLTYKYCAALFGTTRNAIAGVVEGARQMGTPIINTRLPNNRKPRGATAPKRKARPKAAKVTRHAGLTRYVPLGPPPPQRPPEPSPEALAAAWEPLPGSSPVPLERLQGGCRWPCGDSPFLFCNETVRQGSPYCGGHHALAYRPVPPMRLRA